MPPKQLHFQIIKSQDMHFLYAVTRINYDCKSYIWIVIIIKSIRHSLTD